MLGKMEIRTPPGSRPRDGRHCDLCGCSQPAVRCDKCGCQIFCLSCDDMYHRHPKRRFHLRKAVDTIPVAQARPVLPMKVSQLNATNPGDPSKMPLPPPRKKKSLFSSFRKPSPSSEHSPPLPKKEYSWTDRLGSIKKFMSNRPLPPLPNSDDMDADSPPATNGQAQTGDLSFIHKRTDERPPQLPQRSPRSPDFPGMNQEKENRIPSMPPPLPPGQFRNGSLEPNANHMNQNHEFNINDPNLWNNAANHQNDAQAFGTLQRQRSFMPPGAPGYPGGMHQSSSATDLHKLQNAEGMHGAAPPHYPHYPMNPHMPPHYPYPMYPGYPNYPQYFGNSFANLSNPPTSEGDFSDSESSSRHSSKRHAFRKRAKRSQSVMMDRMAYPGQFFPFGPYPGYGPWGAPMPMETQPSPASSLRSLNRTGRTRRRKKGTSDDDDEELSETSSPMSRPKSSSSDPKEIPRAPLATQTTTSEDESDDNGDKRKNKINTIRRPSDPVRSPSPAVNKKVAKLRKSSSKQSDSDTQESSAARNERRSSDSATEQQQTVRQIPALQLLDFKRSPTPQQHKLRESSPAPPQTPNAASPVQQQLNFQRSPTSQQAKFRESSVVQSTSAQPQASNSTSSMSSETWECRHCTYINPIGNKICQVCCKTATPRTETPVSSHSRASSSSAKHRIDSVGSENEYFVPEENNETEASKKETQDMASLNSALDEAEKQISRGLEELMKLKDDIDLPNEKPKPSENDVKPVYKSSGRMRTSILDKLNLNKSQTANASVSTSTETQTDQNNRTIDKIIEARRLSNSSSASETYNSPVAQSPDLERGFQINKQKRDSSCQTQQDSIAEYLEKRKAAEEAFLGRPVNNFGFGYNDRMDMVTSPIPPMYDRYYGGGYGMMQRSHSRASLFTGRMNDFGPMEYGPGPGFGYGPAPMYRSVSRGSLTDYPDGRLSGFHNLRKPDYYLSMEELVERRCQDNINNIRTQGLELVRMIREAEQQGFNADDIQVALSHCGKQNPMEWLQENWRNMLDSVVTLSTNYGNDKKENDIGLLSENEARDALRLHKGNIWAAVTECVEGRQRKYLEISARGNFSRQDIVDALTSSERDVEMAYAKLTKSTGKPFLMRIWGQGEGAQNQDGAQPMTDDFRDGRRRYLKDDTLNHDDLSDDLWSDDEDAVDWDDDEDYEEERGDIEDLRTCQEDLPSNPQEMTTPESEKSDYLDAYSIDDRNVSSPSDDVFFVIPEAKPEKKKGFLSKLVALRRDSKERAETDGKEEISPQKDNHQLEVSISQKLTASSDQKNGGALNTLKNKFSAIKDTVTGGTKNDKKMPNTQVERRTIIVRGQLEHESLSAKDETTSSPIRNSPEESISNISKSDAQNKEHIKHAEESPTKETSKSIQPDNIKGLNLSENNQIKTEKISFSNESTEVDSKKAESKSSQSLAERLKFAKKTNSAFDAPGPSGISKDSLVRPAVRKEDTPVQTSKENSFQKPENLKSNVISEKHDTTDKINVDKISSFQNQEKSLPKEENIKIIQTNQQVPENIANVKTVKSGNIQNTENLQAEKVPSKDLSKKSNVATPTTSDKTDALTKKSGNSDILERKKETSTKSLLSQVANKQSAVENESQIKSLTETLSKTETAKLKENKPSSVLLSSKNEDYLNTSEVAKQDHISKANTSMTVTNAQKSNSSSPIKKFSSQTEKSESAVSQSNEFSGKGSDMVNKIPVPKEKDIQESGYSKTNYKKSKIIKEENKTTQETENKSDNAEKTVKMSKSEKTSENLENSKSIDNQNDPEISQKLLEENNEPESIISSKEENLVIQDNLNVTKHIDSAKRLPTEIPINKENSETTTSEKILKTKETQKTSSQENIETNVTHDAVTTKETPNIKSGISYSHTVQIDDDLTKPERKLIDSDASQNLKESNETEIPKHVVQNNFETLKSLPENKSISVPSNTFPDLPSTSSNANLENPPSQLILENDFNQLELLNDKPKGKCISDEASSIQVISNQTNVVQNSVFVNEQNSSANNEYGHTDNFSKMSLHKTEAAQKEDTDISPSQNLEHLSENSQNLIETKKETSKILSESNTNIITDTETKKSIKEEENKEIFTPPSTAEGIPNLVSSTSSLPSLVQSGDSKINTENNSLKNDVKAINKNTDEQPRNELSINEIMPNEKEIVSINNSNNKSSESELKKSGVKEVISEEEDKLLAYKSAPEKAPLLSPEVIQNTSVSTEIMNKVEPVLSSLTSEVNNIPSNFPEQIKEQQVQQSSISESSKNTNLNSSEVVNKEIANETKLAAPEMNSTPANVSEQIKEQVQPSSVPETYKSTDLNSSEIISKETFNETKLEAPVFSKEFPSKSTVDDPETLPSNDKMAMTLGNNSEPTTSNANVSDNLKITENASGIKTSDSDKTLKASFSKNNLENAPSLENNIFSKSEVILKQETVPVDSKTTVNDSVADSSITGDNSLNSQITQASNTEGNSENANIVNFSSLEKIISIANTVNDSIKEAASNTVGSIVATSSTSTNASGSSKTIPPLTNTTTSDNNKSREISVSELSTSSSDVRSPSNDTRSSALKPNEQHSKAPETISSNSSAATNVTDSSSANSVSSLQSKKFQRTLSEEKKEASSSESEDTDTEFSGYSGYSDNSRRGSLLLPSAIDTLRSRFEGLASRTTAISEPIRPASPFRRMSFNSRKQVIALERKRDTSADKPWYHKIDPEPVKIVKPKRSVKQQLEIERKVRKMVADRKCRTYKKAEIVVQLMDMNFEEDEAIQAANECNTLEQAISYLQQECLLCAGHFPVSQIVSMTHCQHRACWECIRAYFTVQIRDRTILDLLCPFCNEPDIGDEDVAQDYFNHLDIMLKKLVDTEIHELFQRKLRDRVLMKDPNFRWCSQCSSGFIAMPNLKRLICPDCNAVTCASCRRLWEKEHQGISCEAFAAMKDATDPEAQAAGLAKMLTEDGISCPSCHFRYALAKGGCMHFRCIQCQHDFCSGCSRPFKMGQKCGVSEFCAKLGLHAHHPRNCLFYLRDKEPEDLQKLLDMSDVKYNRESTDGMEITTTCQVMEQKETADGMVDDHCGKEVQDGYAGLCRLHYVEYLGQLVNKYKVDPIQIFDNDDLELVLKRANIRLPPKRYRENDAQYREKLIKVIQEELPLDRMDGS